MGGIYRSGDHTWFFPSGAQISLGHMQHEDNKYDYQGREFSFIGFDELTHFSLDQYLYLFSRCRSPHKDLPKNIRCTSNPGGIGNEWVRERFINVCAPSTTFIDPETGMSRRFIPAGMEDNPTLLENDPMYLNRLMAMRKIDRDRLLLGDWDSFEGQVFSELSSATHGIEPFEIPPEWYRFMSFDWGYSSPFAVGWYAVDFDGVLYRYREWYGKDETSNFRDTGLRMEVCDIARGIIDREMGEKISARVADPAIWSRTPSKNRHGLQGPSVHEDMLMCGLSFMKADNDRVQGRQQVHRRFELHEQKLNDGSTSQRPKFYYFKNQQYFSKIMLSLVESKKNREDVHHEGVEDHIYDEFRYACMFRPITPHPQKVDIRGTFKAERDKLKRARAYAKTHGVDLATAYTRVRG